MIELKKYAAGEIIIKENEHGDCAYIIAKGRVEVSKDDEGEKVVLATLEEGETFGEMSIIDEKPRSATVAAVESCEVWELQRDNFFENIQKNSENGIRLLKSLFERLREADGTILHLRHELNQKAHEVELTDDVLSDSDKIAESYPDLESGIYLEGLTPEAIESIPENPYRINKFPFLIGRDDGNPLTHNNLMIDAKVPWQVSQHHCKLILNDGKVGVWDRGSTLGSEVDGQRVGGGRLNPQLVYIQGREGVVVLGDFDSPYRFKLIMV